MLEPTDKVSSDEFHASLEEVLNSFQCVFDRMAFN